MFQESWININVVDESRSNQKFNYWTNQGPKTVGRLLEITHCNFWLVHNILWKKAMDRVAIEEIKEVKWRERNKNKFGKVVEMVTRLEKINCRLMEKHAKFHFISFC
jgi:hypothetical protein